MRILRPLHLGLLTLAVACGGSDNGPTGTLPTTGPISARINGTSWAASNATAIQAAPGLYTITGLNTSGQSYTMVFQLYNIGTAGTYPLGAGPQIFGGAITVSHPTLGGWSTPLNGAAGTIAITTLTSTRLAGTFEFSAAPLTGGASGNLAVVNGVIDVPVTTSAGVGALPANAGNKVTATINGSAYAAGAASSIYTTGASPTLTIAATNLERNITISLANITAAGSFPLSATSPVRTIQVSGTPGNLTATWGSQLTGGSGTATITTISASRIVGSFSAALVPLGGGATGTLTITGNFDMGR